MSVAALLGVALLGAAVPAAQNTTPPQDVPPEVAQGSGPRGTSGEAREDAVGFAELLSAAPEGRWATVTIGVGHPTLAPGTAVELTALDTGRTIVALVVAARAGAVVALSPGAAQALGVGDHAAVRVRTLVTSPQDLRALQAGQPASPRLDAPPTLLAALRRKLPATASESHAAAAPRAPAPPVVHPTRPAPVPVESRGTVPPDSPTGASRAAPRPAPAAPPPPHAKPAPAHGGLVVQVAALSSAERAATLAKQLGGRVVPLGKLFRVQLGPFADSASAQRARDGATRRGYADARILHTD